jgi:DnaJ family protein C protein 9
MDVVKELFDSEDLYEILGVSKDKVENEKALRSAYMKAALKYHPDKAAEEDREAFTKKFQVIQKIYELFKDADLRKIYDDTGSWPEDDKFELDVASFGRLDVNAILEFKKMYQGSDEERQDIKKYYEEGQGDIFYVCDNVFFLNVLDDEDRVNTVVDGLIESGEMTRLTKGEKGEKAREKKLKKAQKEAKEAEEELKKRNLGGGLEALQNAIAKNHSARGNFLDNLAAKYGAAEADSKKSKNSGKKKSDAPDAGPSAKKSKSKSAASNGSGTSGSGRVTRSRSNK